MTWLPVVVRELGCAARRRQTFRLRELAVLAAFAIVAWHLAVSAIGGGGGGSWGRVAFISLSRLTFLFSLLAGALTTADCISAEKREGTLGLLFLTSLKGRDVAFGKLTSTSIAIVYAILGLVPLLAVTVMMGGVTLLEVG